MALSVTPFLTVPGTRKPRQLCMGGEGLRCQLDQSIVLKVRGQSHRAEHFHLPLLHLPHPHARILWSSWGNSGWACQGSWIWGAEQVRGFEDLHVGQGLPGSAGEDP